MQHYQEVLRNTFGFHSFRPFQEEVIDAIMSGQDSLTIIPTGGGKSLCYQLPSLLLEGLTIVISPLIALMHDQVKALQTHAIQAQMLNSSLSSLEMQEVYESIAQKQIRMLYIAPERLNSHFIEFLQGVDIALFVIDEAHCLSEWGHEFRQDYLRLALLKEHFPRVPIAAFTATATPQVEQDIIKNLHLNTPFTLRQTTKRDNLHITVQKRIGNGKEQLLEFLKHRQNQSGIVYTLSRKESEEFASFLVSKGFHARAYHARIDSELKKELYDAFMRDEVQIVVATIAFGMGIDKSNIRFVVHTSMPKTLENFYQEIGRAGRDGLSSDTLLLYTKADEIKRLDMIESGEISNPHYKAILTQKLNTIYRFASSKQCRHQLIAHYFGDSIEACGSRCDSCQRGEVEEIDITTQAQKLLSTILKVEQNFGQTHIIDILRGSKSKKIEQFEHQHLSVYNIGREHDKKGWMVIIDHLFDIEAISQGEYRNLMLLPFGVEILKGKERVNMDKQELTINQEMLQKEREEREYPKFFEAFQSLRAKFAHEQSLAAYMIFHDNTLIEMAKQLPQSKEAFLSIDGVGEVKFEKYGQAFLELSQSLYTPSPPQKLHKTYLETYELIQEGNDIDAIVEIRGLKLHTIIKHIRLLQTQHYIQRSKADELLQKVIDRYPTALKELMQKAMENYSIDELKEAIYLYEELFL